MPGVSLVSVVYNEEAGLSQLLPTIRPLVDQIVIVDQSSTDRTHAIAAQYADILLTDAHSGYAETSRMLAHSYVDQEWTLVIDGDEMPSRWLLDNLHSIIDTDYDWIGLMFEERVGNSLPFSFFHPRLFRTGYIIIPTKLHMPYKPYNTNGKNMRQIAIQHIKTREEQDAHEDLYTLLAPGDTHSRPQFHQGMYSQNNEDGILSYLIEMIPDIPNFFVEFGVEVYEESNTRLLFEQGWDGLVFDGSSDNVHLIHQNFPRLEAVAKFITCENIADLLKDRDIGILSIDIDGNDYWVWDAIQQTPPIIVIEYNGALDRNRSLVVPYDPNFVWDGQTTYYGASLKALNDLAQKKGYSLVYCNGINAFFIHKDWIGDLLPQKVSDIFVEFSGETLADDGYFLDLDTGEFVGMDDSLDIAYGMWT